MKVNNFLPDFESPKKKMKLISNSEISAKDSKIGILFNSLRKYDEASYEKLLIQYENILK